MTYSLDFRQQVLRIKAQEKLSFRQTAKRFGISPTSLLQWMERVEPKRTRNKASKIDMQALKEDIERNPDAYQYERARHFGMSQQGIARAMKRLGVTYKKKPESPEGQSRRQACLPE
jgi:transposase